MKQRITAILMAALICLSLAACSSGGGDYSSNNSLTSVDSVSGLKDFSFNGGLGFESNQDQNTETSTPEEDTPAEQPTTQALNEKLIFTGSLQIETIDFSNAVTALESLVAQYNGFIEQSDIDGRTVYNEDGTAKIINRTADFTLRIPAADFSTVMQQAGNIGNITSSNSEAVNVTSQFTDNEARLNSLKIQEERLLDMLNQTAELSDLLELEKRLSDVRYEIELIERTLRDLQTSVSYSTIHIHLSEVAGYEETISVQRTFLQRVGDALKDGCSGFISVIQGLIIGIAGSLPALILLIIIVIILWKVAKKNKTSGKSILQKSADAAARLADGKDDKTDKKS